MTRALSRDYLECYERLARDDLRKAFELQPWRRQIAILRMVGNTEGKVVVDIGTGKGWTVSRLKGTKVATDIALQYLRRSRFSDSHRVRAAAEFLPFRKCADVVLCDSVLEHVLDPHRVVKEIRRIIKQDGRAFFSVPYKEDLSPYQKLSTTYPYTHLRSFDKNSIKAILKGFSIEKVQMVHLKQYPVLIRFVLRQLRLRFQLLYKAIRKLSICSYIIVGIDSLFCRFHESHFALFMARPESYDDRLAYRLS